MIVLRALSVIPVCLRDTVVGLVQVWFATINPLLELSSLSEFSFPLLCILIL